MPHLVAPSLLAADFSGLKAVTEMVNASAADWLHLDVMDGVFVPNISFGLPVVEAMARHAKKPLDVHLMITEPDRYLADFRKAGADVLTVHYEACTHLHRTLQVIRNGGAQTGVALNPHTPVEVLSEVLPHIDVVCLMSVNPGFGGQNFIPESLDKISRLKKLITTKKTNTKIEVDGGVNMENAPHLLSAGADILVAGSTVFKSDDPTRTIEQLKNLKSAVQAR